MRRRVIFTADDFGLSLEVNAAVERAHHEGVLTAASLMVSERATPEAVEVARRNPGLAVGLHLTLTDGAPALPPGRIPALARADGRFRDDMAGVGFALAASAAAREQLRAEVAAFRAAGLACDHLNARTSTCTRSSPPSPSARRAKQASAPSESRGSRPRWCGRWNPARERRRGGFSRSPRCCAAWPRGTA